MANRTTAYVAVSLSAFGWALSPVFIRYLSTPYDPFTQTFVRYSAAVMLLVPFSLWAHRDGMRQAFRMSATIAALAALNVLNQLAWTVACYHTTATTAQLMTKLQVPSTIILSFIVFREERAIIRTPLFLGGTALGLFGVAGVLIDDPQASLLPGLDLATLLLLYVAVGWAVYVVWAKHTVVDLHPVPMFTLLSVYSTMGFGALAWVFGEPRSILEVDGGTTALALSSGILPIAIAHSAYHYGQKYLGSAFCATILLVNPLITHVIALFLWRDEHLVWIQWVGGAVLIAGSLMVIRAERTARAGHSNTA